MNIPEPFTESVACSKKTELIGSNENRQRTPAGTNMQWTPEAQLTPVVRTDE